MILLVQLVTTEPILQTVIVEQISGTGTQTTLIVSAVAQSAPTAVLVQAILCVTLVITTATQTTVHVEQTKTM